MDFIICRPIYSLKDEDVMLILDQNDIFYGPNIVYISMWFLQLRAWIFQLPGC